MRVHVIGAGVLALLLAACGGDGGVSPRAGCEQAAEALCERLYTCFTVAELTGAGFPSSEGACVTMTETQNGCSAQTNDNACTGNETYHADEAADCIDQIAGLECSQVRDENLDINDAAPACGRVCSVD